VSKDNNWRGAYAITFERTSINSPHHLSDSHLWSGLLISDRTPIELLLLALWRGTTSIEYRASDDFRSGLECTHCMGATWRMKSLCSLRELQGHGKSVSLNDGPMFYVALEMASSLARVSKEKVERSSCSRTLTPARHWNGRKRWRRCNIYKRGKAVIYPSFFPATLTTWTPPTRRNR